MQKRTVPGARKGAKSAEESASGDGRARRGEARIIMGIDPSLRGTGYGVIEWGGGQPVARAHGTIKSPPGWERSRCLAHIAGTLRDVLKLQRPTVCVMEGLFFAQNIKTALIMGEARGAALAVVAEAGLPIYEIAPRRMKLAIVGYGAASKTAVGRMVQRMLGLADLPGPDAADALALALAHEQQNGRIELRTTKRI